MFVYALDAADDGDDDSDNDDGCFDGVMIVNCDSDDDDKT